MGRPVRYGGEFPRIEERRPRIWPPIAEQALADIPVSDDDAFRRYIRPLPWGVVFRGGAVELPVNDLRSNTVAPCAHRRQHGAPQARHQTLLAESGWRGPFTRPASPRTSSRIVFLDHDTSSALIRERAVDFVNFTGSVPGGQAMSARRRAPFVPVATELGGKDPGYVMDDADLERRVDGLMDGAMFNSGQCCCGIERIYVHQSLYDAFVEKAVAWAGARSGSAIPLDPETTLGPMAHVRFARLCASRSTKPSPPAPRPTCPRTPPTTAAPT